MSKIIAVSGASATGKTTLMEELKKREELKDAIFLDDIFETVWNDLVERGIFHDFDDISRDTEFLCIFIQRVIDYYKMCIEDFKYDSSLIIMESSWIDVSIYSITNMWYTHIVKEVQEGLLYQLGVYDDSIDKIYITKYDEGKRKVEKYHCPYKRYSVKYNRDLELRYYRLYSHFKNAEELQSSDTVESADQIIEDLKNIGYL